MSFEIALLIGLLANALAILIGVWVGTRKLSIKLEEVKLASNGVKDQLVAASQLVGEAVGEKRGRLAAADERRADDEGRVATATERVADATERVATASEIVTPTSQR